ncbi:unnamed protein product [Albugo candida]|uniref:Uncharacterized protein n=1 Tax=Albugo candida TaxID=65357 RepID=A0A024GR65_9STRA|nr:unnamed protein product [Albugo candida]|eukprot:CCI48843.1 unnamed protein product [Albugo candida]
MNAKLSEVKQSTFGAELKGAFEDGESSQRASMEAKGKGIMQPEKKLSRADIKTETSTEEWQNKNSKKPFVIGRGHREGSTGTIATGNNNAAKPKVAGGGAVRPATTQGDGGQATGTKTEATATGSGDPVVSTHPGRTNAETTSKTAGGDIAHQVTHPGATIKNIETINPSRTGGTTVSTRAIENNAGANTQTASGGIAGSVTTGGNGRQSSETTTEAVARTSGGAAAATDTTGANNVGHGTGTSTVSNGRPPATRSPDASPDGEPGLASPETVDANKEKRKDAKIRAATLGLVAGSAAVGVTSLGLQGISMANQQAGSNNANNTTTTQAPPTQSKPFIQPIVGDGYPTGYPQLGVPFPGSLPTGMPPNGPFPQSVSPATFPPVVRTLSTILTPQRLRGLIVNPRQ